MTTYAQINAADGQVLNLHELSPQVAAELALAGCLLIALRDGAPLPTPGQRYSSKTQTFTDDLAWLAERFEAIKQARLADVATRTQALLAAGTPWKDVGRVAIDQPAATKIHSVLGGVLLNLPGVFPLTWINTDGAPFQIADAAEFGLFYGTMLAAGVAIEEAGVTLAQHIGAATTQADLDAIVDTRK